MRRLAHGTKLKMGDGASSETFTTVVQLTRIGLPQGSRASVDTSDHDTTDFMTFLAAALADGGTVTAEGHFDPAVATHGMSAGAGIVKAFHDGTLRNWRIEDVAGTVWRFSFSGFVTVLGGDAPSESGSGKLTFTFEIKISGTPTLAAPA